MLRPEDIRQEKRLGNNRRVTILDTEVDVLTMQETVSLTEQYILNREPLHLMGVNADKINSLRQNELLKTIVNSCGIINADGASVILAGKMLGKRLPERVAGIDLMDRLTALCEKKGYSVYFLGAKQEVVEKTAEVLKEKYPKLIIKGIHNGYFSEEQWKEISDEIKTLDPEIVFVGITSPLKEYLVEYMQNEGNKTVFMGVGGSFDVISGNIERAPAWMQKANLEWMFRMIQEPKRLFKRYMVGNAVFVSSVIREKITERKGV